MATIHEIRLRLDEFVSNLETNIQIACYSVAPQILELNKSQMDISKGSDDAPLINIRTGKRTLSKGYAARVNKLYPDILVTGEYRKDMYLDVNTPQKYFISSRNQLVKYIPQQYLNVHGVAPSNEKSAKQLTTKAISEQLSKNVFKS
jgi:hypothetical protein